MIRSWSREVPEIYRGSKGLIRWLCCEGEGFGKAEDWGMANLPVT